MGTGAGCRPRGAWLRIAQGSGPTSTGFVGCGGESDGATGEVPRTGMAPVASRCRERRDTGNIPSPPTAATLPSPPASHAGGGAARHEFASASLPSADGRADDDEIARLPVSPTDVSETEKVEGFRTSLSTQSPALGGIAPEFNQARFLRVQFQPEFRHALLQCRQESQGVFAMLKPQHRVVGIPDDNHVASRLRPPPLVHPEVEDVMQVEISQGRRNYRALGRPFLRLEPPALLHDPRLQPFLDEADDTSVPDAMLDKALHPTVIDLVEERSDIQVEHPVHFLARNPDVEGIQRVVLAAPRPEPIREAQKVLFPHTGENRSDRMLDDFVLQRGDTQWPLPAIAFRNPGDRKSTRLTSSH